MPRGICWRKWRNILGSNLYPANLINVIENNNTIKTRVERLAYHQYENGGQNEIDILVELKGFNLNKSEQKQMHEDIVNGLKEKISEAFRKSSRGARYQILFFMRPMHEWSKKPRSKHKYVFRGKEINMDGL